MHFLISVRLKLDLAIYGIPVLRLVYGEVVGLASSPIFGHVVLVASNQWRFFVRGRARVGLSELSFALICSTA